MQGGTSSSWEIKGLKVQMNDWVDILEYKYTYLKVQMNDWAFRFTGESYIY